MASHQATPISSEEAGHEVTDAPMGPIVLSLGILTLFMFLVIFTVIGMLRSLETTTMKHEDTHAIEVEEPVERPIGLQVDPAMDMEEMRQANEAILHNYGWIDKGAGKVHIPIDKAMELALERGDELYPARETQ